MNNVILIGRLIRDPELRYATTQTAMTQFTLAVDRNLSREKKAEAERNGQPTADFIRIIAWGKTAELAANYLAKGNKTAIRGRIQTGSYTNSQGQRVYTTDIVADEIEFIEWGKGTTNTQNDATDENRASNELQEPEDFVPFKDDSKIPF